MYFWEGEPVAKRLGLNGQYRLCATWLGTVSVLSFEAYYCKKYVSLNPGRCGAATLLYHCGLSHFEKSKAGNQKVLIRFTIGDAWGVRVVSTEMAGGSVRASTKNREQQKNTRLPVLCFLFVGLHLSMYQWRHQHKKV